MTLEGYGNPQPIHEAARHADVAALRQILGEGVSPNLADDYGSMPLQFLCTKDEGDADNRVTCFNILVEAGADAHAETAKMTPLILAARCGPPKLVAEFIKVGANVNWHDSTGWTPLHWACWRNDPSAECVELLLNAGAPVNAITDMGRNTPLGLAIIKGNQQRIYPSLLRAGAFLPEAIWRGAPLHGRDVYLRKVRAARGFKKYERTHLNAIAATFIPKLPLLPPEMVRRVVEYAFHVGDY